MKCGGGCGSRDFCFHQAQYTETSYQIAVFVTIQEMSTTCICDKLLKSTALISVKLGQINRLVDSIEPQVQREAGLIF